MFNIFRLLLILSLCSCLASKKAKKNTLNTSINGKISTLDPANSYDTISATVIYQSYEQLYEYHYLKRPYVLQPLLAEGMPTIDETGLIYTIKIKKGVRYHDNPAFKGKIRYVKAQDFVNGIKRLAYMPTKSNGWWLFDGRIKGLNKFRKEAARDLSDFESYKVEGLYAKDDYTLVIKLTEVYPQMLYAFAMSFTSPIPIEAIHYYKNNLNENIVGTGPYQFVEWLKGVKLKMKRFKDYREAFYPREGDRLANSKGFLKDSGKRIPFIDEVQFTIVNEAPTRWLKFLNGELDYIIIPKDNFTSAVNENGDITDKLKKKKIRLQVGPALIYWWLAFNMKDEILGQNLNLRKAIAHAIDFQKYITIFTNKFGLKANSIYPPGIPGYTPSQKLPYEYNLDKAREYLKLAGYPGGKGLPALTYDMRGKSTTNRQKADFIKNELKKIGITLNVEINTFPAFLQKSRTGKLQFWQGGWALDYPDAENILQLLITKNHPPGPNASFYSNPDFDKGFEELKTLHDSKRKRELMVELENIVNKDLPWIMQYYARTNILIYDHLQNYRHSDLIYNRVKYLKIK